MPSAKSLTTKDVARLCRVSDATVKRWAEAGLLPSERTSGGHRRFRVEDVARFQREAGLGLTASGGESAVKEAVGGRTRKSQSESALFHALVNGREEETTSILVGALMNGGGLPRIFDTILSEAMFLIGELWYAGELSIAEEHLATRTAATALQKLRSLAPAVAPPHGELAICCTIENDLHELPAFLAQMILENAGWEVLNFGANLPLYVLSDEVRSVAPALVCISATILPDIERAARDYREFRAGIVKTNAAIVLGGRALGDERVRRRFAAEFYPTGFSELAEFAQKLSART